MLKKILYITFFGLFEFNFCIPQILYDITQPVNICDNIHFESLLFFDKDLSF